MKTETWLMVLACVLAFPPCILASIEIFKRIIIKVNSIDEDTKKDSVRIYKISFKLNLVIILFMILISLAKDRLSFPYFELFTYVLLASSFILGANFIQRETERLSAWAKEQIITILKKPTVTP